MKAYSDQVSAAPIAAALRLAGLQFEQTTSYGTKAAEKYQTLRQKVVSGELVLPDNEMLVGQLKRLEEILAEGGRSTVEARVGKDDVAVAAAVAIHFASLNSHPREPVVGIISPSGTRWSDQPKLQSDYDPFDDTGFRPRSRGPSFGPHF